mmetsp:Transcript_4365/g.9822  ORF Transcript_4365/g.9822 Transcript_4365/m.9822 type:complete len:280 (+) Transcript_4365:3564-4403(+)
MLTQSENGLGTKVLSWMAKDIHKWAKVLGNVDEAGNALSATSINQESMDHPQSFDAAILTKRDCRTIFIQIAQQTRLRSIFTSTESRRISGEILPQVLKSNTFAMTEWEDQPSWWNEPLREDPTAQSCTCKSDMELLGAILDYGYGGYDSMAKQDYGFAQKARTDESVSFTRAAVQARVNHLTRELHEVIEREHIRSLMGKKRPSPSKTNPVKKQKHKSNTSGGIQAGLQAFFTRPASTKPSNDKKKSNSTPPTSPECDEESPPKRRKQQEEVECVDLT